MLKGFSGILELAKYDALSSISQLCEPTLWNICKNLPSDISTTKCISMEEIITFSQYPKCEIVPNNIGDKCFIFNNIEMRLRACLKFSANDIIGGTIDLMDTVTDEYYMQFSVEKWPYFKVKKIKTFNNNELLLVQSGKTSVSGNICTGLWIIGKIHDEIVPFIDINVLRNVGLIYQDIASSIEYDAIKLLGYARDRDCRIESQSKNGGIDYQYQGHTAYQLDCCNCGINVALIKLNICSNKLEIRLMDYLPSSMKNIV